jgi:hypothetical protein
LVEIRPDADVSVICEQVRNGYVQLLRGEVEQNLKGGGGGHTKRWPLSLNALAAGGETPVWRLRRVALHIVQAPKTDVDAPRPRSASSPSARRCQLDRFPLKIADRALLIDG